MTGARSTLRGTSTRAQSTIRKHVETYHFKFTSGEPKPSKPSGVFGKEGSC